MHDACRSEKRPYPAIQADLYSWLLNKTEIRARDGPLERETQKLQGKKNHNSIRPIVGRRQYLKLWTRVNNMTSRRYKNHNSIRPIVGRRQYLKLWTRVNNITSRRYKNLHHFINCNTRIFNQGQSSTSVTLDTARDWCNLCTMIMTQMIMTTTTRSSL